MVDTLLSPRVAASRAEVVVVVVVMDEEEVVLLLEAMADDWNAHVPDVAVAVITAKSALENFIVNPSSSSISIYLYCNSYDTAELSSNSNDSKPNVCSVQVDCFQGYFIVCKEKYSAGCEEERFRGA